MATGFTPSPSSSFSDKEKTNHTRLSRLLIDIGRRVLQDVFDSIHPPSSLHGVLNSTPERNKLQRLQSRKILYYQQWNTLYPTSGIAESKNFDITLLFLLLRTICGLRPPASTGSWDKQPLPTDLSVEADLVRIKRCRNELYAHKVEMALTDNEFENSWDDIKAALNRLGKLKYKKEIERLKFASMDPEKDACFMTLCQKWGEEEGTLDIVSKENKVIINKLDKVLEVVTAKEATQGDLNVQEKRATKAKLTISGKVVRITAGGLVAAWPEGSAYIINRYIDDPETTELLITEAIALAATSVGWAVKKIIEGSFQIIHEVYDVIALDSIWESYSKTKMLQEKLQEVLITEELKNRAPTDTERVELSIVISEDEYKKARDTLQQLEDKVADADFKASMQTVINGVIKNVKYQTSFHTDELQNIKKQLDEERIPKQEPQTFCYLPPKPTHYIVQRASEVDAIIEEMESLQNSYPTEVTQFYLSGNPGCGKSEVARQIGEKMFHQNSSGSTKACVVTLNASNLNTLLNSYIECSRRLKVDENYIQNIASSNSYSTEDKIRHFIGLVNPKFALFSWWLIIVDNVVNLKQFVEFFPSLNKEIAGKGQILVATQDSQSVNVLDPKVHHRSLSKGMMIDDAVNALHEISQQSINDKDVVNQIANELDCQPLALACTAYYMHEANQCDSNFTWANCLTKIQEGNRQQTEKPYLDASGNVYSLSMTSAVKMALERVFQEDNIMKCAFQFLSVLAQDPIPIHYLAQYVLLNTSDDDENLIEARIARSSLLICDDLRNAHVHQVVFALLSNAVNVQTEEKNCTNLAKMITTFLQLVVDDEEPDTSFVTRTKPLVSHFVAFEKIVSKNLSFLKSLSDDQKPLVAKCLSRAIGKICHIHGQLKVARRYLEMSIAIGQIIPDGQEILGEQNALGEILYDLGDFQKAKECFEDVHNGVNKSDGLYLRVLTNLGMTYSSDPLREFQKAKRCLEKALSLVEKMAPDNPFAGRIWDNIAMVHLHLENYKEAKVYIVKALDIDKEKYGKNHPYISERYNNFALVLHRLGEHNMAKRYLKKSISDYMNQHEENHPSLSTYYGNYGSVLHDLAQLEEAQIYLQKAIDIDKVFYDDNNPALAMHLNNLGLVLRDLKHYREAEICLKGAVEIYQRIYGEKNGALAISLHNYGLALKDLEQYENAKIHLEEAVMIAVRVFGENDLKLAEFFYNFGLVLKDLNQYADAKKYLKKAVAIDQVSCDDDHPALPKHLHDLGMVLKDLEQYKDAMIFLQGAVDVANLVCDKDDQTLSLYSYDLGMILKDLGKPEEACKYLQIAVDIDEVVLCANDSILGTHSYHLGEVLKDLGQHEHAKKYLQRAVDIGRNAYYADNDPTLGWYFSDLGVVLRILRKYKDAKKFLEQALAIFKRVYGNSHYKLLVHLRNLCLVLRDLRKYNDAHTYIQQAVEIAERTYGDTDFEVGFYRKELGTVLKDLAQYEDARRCLERAVDIYKRVYDDKHPKLAEVLRNLGLVLKDLGQYKDAQKYLQQAFDIADYVYNDSNSELVIYLRSLGMMLECLGQYELAKKYIQRAVDIAERSYDKDHPMLATILNDFGTVLQDLGQLDESKRCHQRAVEIAERCYDKDNPTLARILDNFGSVLRDLGQIAESMKCVQRAVEIAKRSYCKDHPMLAKILNDFGLVLRNLGEIDESKKYVQQAVEIAQRSFIKDHPLLATILNCFGLVLKDLKELEKSKQYHQKAVDIAERVYDDKHPELAAHLYHLGMVLKELGQYEDAKKCLQRAVDIGEVSYSRSSKQHFNNLILVLTELEQIEDARKCIERAAEIYKHVYNGNDQALAAHLHDLGMLLKDIGQYELAKKYLQEAVDIDKDSYGRSLSLHCRGLIAMLKDLGKDEDDVKRYIKKAAENFERIYHRNHQALATHLNDLGKMLKVLGQYEDAEKCLQRVVDIKSENNPNPALHLRNLCLNFREIRQSKDVKKYIQQELDAILKNGDKEKELCVHLNALGLVLRDFRQNEEAKTYLQNALSIAKRVYADNHPELARHWNDLGNVQRDFGQYGEAKRCMQTAVDIAENAYGKIHPKLAIYLNDLGLVYKDLGQHEKATQYKQRAAAINRHIYKEKHPYQFFFFHDISQRVPKSLPITLVILVIAALIGLYFY